MDFQLSGVDNSAGAENQGFQEMTRKIEETWVMT